jgi:DNA helicase-2/ATP-dependent DNA helicase PcrA
MNKNKLIIAAAGSGKTTYLVERAKKIKDEKVLITTYTEENEAEIRQKFYGRIPQNITIQTWFSFLLQHGVRPYQSVMNSDLHDMKVGFYLTERPSGVRFFNRAGRPVGYWGEKDFFKYYFSRDMKIYSDKISKFIVDCNQKTNGEVINRITRLYPHIFIDEVQDLAGWELEILKLFFNSASKIMLVGDPRQVTYLTHHPKKYSKYKDGKIKEFIESECSGNRNIKEVEIDETTLSKSHRNNKWICGFSSKLYSNYAACEPCECESCRSYTVDHEGVFLIREQDVEAYLRTFMPVQLRWSNTTSINRNFTAYNFGKSKGLSFDRVLIYPTSDMRKWIFDNSYNLKPETRAKFYVATTRAKFSVGIVCDCPDDFVETEELRKWLV